MTTKQQLEKKDYYSGPNKGELLDFSLAHVLPDLIENMSQELNRSWLPDGDGFLYIPKSSKILFISKKYSPEYHVHLLSIKNS